jgi:hypothetical protein
MPLDLNQVAAKRAVTTVTYQGQTAQLTFNPSYLTAENVMAARNGDSGLTNFLMEAIVDWDIRRATKKVPIKEVEIRKLPLGLVRAIFTELAGGGGTGDPTTDSNSNDG